MFNIYKYETRIKAGRGSSFTPEKQMVDIEQLENRGILALASEQNKFVCLRCRRNLRGGLGIQQ